MSVLVFIIVLYYSVPKNLNFMFLRKNRPLGNNISFRLRSNGTFIQTNRAFI